ncbi:TetR/AcrR family transcriptional regulator [Candidatus Villigracilis saccharophilus]|uniref:TetR/AcrR family transcriptional regulator n=1 Tax=Candidatus Villigracilis saccharophilus TaxID=3140684 RepID=UPI0031351538|nr:TetR/AcrR family transcriptional regulator [Anaerolineales bacterium]
MLPNSDEKLDPRVIRTRGLILKSFEDLLAEKNFESVSVQDVTDKAQVNRATFYAHFPDKYALLDYSIQKMFMTEIEKRTLNVCSYSQDNLRNLILAVVEFLSHLHTGCVQPHQQFESLVEGTIKKQIFDLLSYWLRKSNVPTELPATVATWAIYGLASHYSHMKKRPALEKFVDEAFPLVAVNLEQFA